MCSLNRDPCTRQRGPEGQHYQLLTSITTHFPMTMKDIDSESIVTIASNGNQSSSYNTFNYDHNSVWQLHLCNRVYLFLSPSTCIIDMKRTEKNKAFKSKKPYDRRSMHGTGPSTSTPASAGTTDLMPYAPASDLDATSSAQVTAGGSVSLPFASLSIDSYLLLSSRPPISSESLGRILLWKSVTFFL